jgi:hypothetical protein
MAPKKEIKTTSKWDAELNRNVCDRYNNCDLTLTIRMHMQKIDPPGGTAKGTYKDADNHDKKIVRWGAHWLTWTSRFRREVEKFWSGKFWLLCPDSFSKYDFHDRSNLYRPNLWCRFRLKLVDSSATAHHSIAVVRLDSSETFFRSHSELYDDHDIDPQPQAHGSSKMTHLHEVGHLLGLPHVGVGGTPSLGSMLCSLNVAVGGTTNDDACYGLTDDEKRDVMGSGHEVHAWHAKPWQEAAEMFSGVGQSQWLAELKRYYPRTTREIASKTWPTAKPARG